MAGSSPAPRRSRQWSSPSRSPLSELMSENRHTELSHQDALAAAQAEHERVRETAIRVYHEHALQEEQRRLHEQELRIRQQQKKEEERIRTEERLRAEEERLRALKAKTVPKLPPEAPPPDPPATAAAAATRVNGSATSNHQSAFASPPAQVAASSKPSPFGLPQDALKNSPNPQLNGVKVAQPAAVQQPFQQQQQPSPFQAKPSPFSQPAAAANPFAKAAAPLSSQQNGSAHAPPKPLVPSPDHDRYVEIHQNLKKLRASIAQEAKSSPLLKQRMGDMRRELRKNMGQLVGERGGNKKQIAAIQALLNESLSGTIPSSPVDPLNFITDKREPVDGAMRNEPHLPSLFLYLLNHFAKAVINQFINECGAQPKTADPIGVVAAMVFSNKAYLWRGKTLIDILMAKFRVVCPVLFGYRGSEKMEQGRLRLGWRRDGPGWTPEQQHNDRMKGLGVGYAAIALRDFSKSPNTNPWPPSRYWTSLAQIVNTPPAEISNTQCVVLRAMIEIYEERFLTFYGSAAIAALRKALVEFPNKAQEKTPAVSGLQVLASILKRDIGLEL
ncbi:GLE1-like protein-domain-containing protein [Biscogniauxia sp. FL1348]|nr:GLE1-like protein-domain-containing protein [Biscogniauxia sp. FL1348]